MAEFEDSIECEIYINGEIFQGLYVEQFSLLTDIVQFESRAFDSRHPMGQNAGLVVSLPINKDLETPKIRRTLSTFLNWYGLVRDSSNVFLNSVEKFKTKVDVASVKLIKSGEYLFESTLKGIFPTGIEFKNLGDTGTAKLVFYFSVDSFSVLAGEKHLKTRHNEVKMERNLKLIYGE